MNTMIRTYTLLAIVIAALWSGTASAMEQFMISKESGIVLDASTKSLKLTTNASGTVNYVISYTDVTGQTIEYGTSNGTISTATTTTVLAAPSGFTKRWVASVNVVNSHASTSVTVTLLLDVSGTTYPIRSNVVLAPGDDFQLPVDGTAAVGGGSGESNTASNLGGGLPNFSTKTGVDLRFNSFDAADFDLASNLISIDGTKWLTISAGSAAYQPLDSDLTSIAALSTTAHGRGLLDDVDAAASRTSINAQAASSELDNLINNCVLDNDSTPIPDSCVGDGVDGGGGGGGISYAEASAAVLAGF